MASPALHNSTPAPGAQAPDRHARTSAGGSGAPGVPPRRTGWRECESSASARPTKPSSEVDDRASVTFRDQARAEAHVSRAPEWTSNKSSHREGDPRRARLWERPLPG